MTFCQRHLLSFLPFIFCAIPLTGAWHRNSSHIHFLLLTISIGMVLYLCAHKKIERRDILESMRLYPTVGLLLILIGQAIQIVDCRLNIEYFCLIFQGLCQSSIFDNPAGLACFSCCLVAIESGNRPDGKWEWLWHWTVIAALVAVVLLCQSRTGVLALMISSLLNLEPTPILSLGRGARSCQPVARIHYSPQRRAGGGQVNIKRGVAGLAVLFCCWGLMQMKQDSTSGRRFILQNTWQMICERPLTGWGWHGFDKHYMQVQAEYFRQHPEDTANAWLADDVRHPMNEFLLWWVRFGIAGPVVLGIMLLGSLTPYPPLLLARGERLQRRKGGDKVTDEGWPIFNLSSLRFTLLTFALLSYPLHYAFAWLFICLAWYRIIDERLMINAPRRGAMGGLTLKSRHISYLSSFISYLLIAVGTFSLFLSARLMQAEEAAARHAHHRALRIYRQLEMPYRWSPHFLYSYARELYVAGLFGKALAYADRCEGYWSRYDLTLLKGDIHRQLRLYDEAEAAYHTATFMCPNRFAPLEGLLTVYQETGDTTAANLTACRILSKGVKVGSEAVAEIQNMARQYISKHNKQ